MTEDLVNHPQHYTSHPSGIECITITRWMNFNLGNAVKYIWRAGLKSADPIQDLKKAEFYIRDEIARLESQAKVLPSMNAGVGSIPKPENYGNVNLNGNGER